jgi:hypothetical protein
MTTRSPAADRGLQSIARAIALAVVLTVVPLLVWDATPAFFPDRMHAPLAAIPLTLIAAASLIYVVARGRPIRDLAKAAIAAAAFLFWAANQLWPDAPKTLLLNDIAITLFVLDGAIALSGWPSPQP